MKDGQKKRKSGAKVKSVVTDFKNFINKGNIIDLATGIIIGTAFTAIVNSLVNDIIMPLIKKAINFDFTNAKVVLKDAVLDEAGEVLVKEVSLNYGLFIQNVINFFIIALSIFVAIKAIKWIRNGYIRSQIRYVKKLKKKHPEFFDEEDEFGTLLYERLKSEHPEYFTDEVALEIEEKKEKVIQEVNPVQLNNQLLRRLNDNLEKIINSNNNNRKKSVKLCINLICFRS